MILRHAAAPRQAFQSGKSAQRLFSMQDSVASRALAAAFDQRHPACLNRLPTVCLQAPSAMADLIGSLCFRRRSQRIRPLLVLQQRMQVATASSRRCGFRSAMTSSIRPAFNRSLIVFIQSFRLLSCGVVAFTAAAFWRPWHWSRMKIICHPGKVSSQVLRIQGAPSDSTANSLAANKPFRSPACRRRAQDSEFQPTTTTALALSMRTPPGPLVLSLFGELRSAFVAWRAGAVH